MKAQTREYTVKGLARLAGITVRTLQYYDAIGLLKPSRRTDSGYRIYRDRDLLILQQIMFYRELEFPLDKIKSILGARDFDLIAALTGHRRMLLEKKRRIGRLIKTIEKTIKKLEEKTMLKDEELYEGFSEKEIKQLKEYEKEAARMYDPGIVAQSQKRVRSMTREKWRSVRAEAEEITGQLASLMDKDPASEEVQEVIARHYQHLGNFYAPTLGMYRGLGEMYVSDPRFRAHYDRYATNLADFLNKAIGVFCDKASRH
jgi:DNA-binding transcriptional MerR regulator